ncbi:MAG: dockerin type I repeat-containing protein, partial [Planctomycetales bacterium]|nr:dockerin type I repeat-containing protein [Planctomycetales bacterium]
TPNTRTGGASMFVGRRVSGQASFTQQITVRDLVFESDDTVDLVPHHALFVTHTFSDKLPGQSVAFGIRNQQNTFDHEFIVFLGDEHFTVPFELTSDVSLAIDFDQHQRAVEFRVEGLGPQGSVARIGPLTYESEIDTHQATEVVFVVSEGPNRVSAGIDTWSYQVTGGDFNGNGLLDVEDIDQLTFQVVHHLQDLRFDSDFNGEVEQTDRDVWIRTIADTYYGDANLDGQFNSQDLVAVFQAAEYEDGNNLNSTWAEGDWNGDGDFTSRDLVFAFQDGGYENGPLVSVAVPEPSVSLIGTLLGLLFWPRVATGFRLRPRKSPSQDRPSRT